MAHHASLPASLSLAPSTPTPSNLGNGMTWTSPEAWGVQPDATVWGAEEEEDIMQVDQFSDPTGPTFWEVASADEAITAFNTQTINGSPQDQMALAQYNGQNAFTANFAAPPADLEGEGIILDLALD